MNEKIKKHIDELFVEAPKTAKTRELKEEMMRNTVERYEDLLGEGYQEEEAFRNAVSSIGDVTELFGELEEKNLMTLSEEDRRRKAVLTAVAVGFYIFAGAVFITCMVLNDVYFSLRPEMGLLSLAITALVCIPPTCMLVYAAHMYPTYRKGEDSLVERYKEAAHTSNREKALRTSVSLIIWLLTLLIYFLTSFLTMRWELTWLLFFVGGCAETVAMLVFSLRKEN